jgi:hypothetical protein
MRADVRQSAFDYNYLLKYLCLRGRDIYGAEFAIPDCDLGVVMQLLAYFLRDEATARRMGMRLNKGILLMGPAGCGKKALMQLMSLFSTGVRKPVIKSCNKVCWEFSHKGLETIANYSTGAISPGTRRPFIYCFHDLGKEARVNYFGASCSVMPEILLRRQDLRMTTHLTTRLTLKELESMYGEYFVNRMLSRFNLVTFDPRSADKRRGH